SFLEMIWEKRNPAQKRLVILVYTIMIVYTACNNNRRKDATRGQKQARISKGHPHPHRRSHRSRHVGGAGTRTSAPLRACRREVEPRGTRRVQRGRARRLGPFGAAASRRCR